MEKLNGECIHLGIVPIHEARDEATEQAFGARKLSRHEARGHCQEPVVDEETTRGLTGLR